jgi:hypothetical protein
MNLCQLLSISLLLGAFASPLHAKGGEVQDNKGEQRESRKRQKHEKREERKHEKKGHEAAVPASDIDLVEINADIYSCDDPKLHTAFQIPTEEKEAITKQGCAPTYGEITIPNGIERIMNRLNALLAQTQPKGKKKFMDIGSGSGKIVIGSVLKYGFQEGLGVEVSETRHKIATNALKKLQKNHRKLIPKGAHIKFVNKDARKVSFKGVHAVWFSNLCTSKELTDEIMQKADKELPDGAVIILSAAATGNYKRIKHLSSETFPMTWTEASSSNVYVVGNPPADINAGRVMPVMTNENK